MQSFPVRFNLPVFVFTLLATSFLAGCGGSGGGSGSPTPTPTPSLPATGAVVFSGSRIVSPIGATIPDSTDNIILTIPAGTFPTATNVGFQVRQSQRADLSPTGFVVNPNSIELTIDPNTMADGSSVQISIPAPGGYDPVGSMVMVTDGAGNTMPLAVSYDSTKNVITATLAQTDLTTLFAAAGKSARVKTAKSRSAAIVPTVYVAAPFVDLTATRGIGINTPKFLVYDTNFVSNPKGPLRDATASDTMQGKHIAIILHGMLNDGSDMTNLAAFLNDELPQSTNLKVYDQVWVFQYDWTRHIADNGTLFAQMLSSQMTGAISVDIYAHSMGGLVARYAIEQEGLGASVKRLITLDTPHEGVPLRSANTFLFNVSPLLDFAANEFLPSLNDLVRPDDSSNTFINDLNQPQSPYHDTVDYYTLAGDTYHLYLHGVGDAVNLAYNEVFALSYIRIHEVPAGVRNDGIVPVYSALSESYDFVSPMTLGGLATKSDSWRDNQSTHTVIDHVRHDEAGFNFGNPDPVRQNQLSSDVKNWIVTSLTGSVQ